MELTVTYGSGWLPCIIDDLKKKTCSSQPGLSPLMVLTLLKRPAYLVTSIQYVEFWMLVPDKWFMVAHITKKMFFFIVFRLTFVTK